MQKMQHMRIFSKYGMDNREMQRDIVSIFVGVSMQLAPRKWN